LSIPDAAISHLLTACCDHVSSIHLNVGKLDSASSIVTFHAAPERRITRFSLDNVDVSHEVITTLAAANAFRTLTSLRLHKIRSMQADHFQFHSFGVYKVYRACLSKLLMR
jgi:hypothetical protein